MYNRVLLSCISDTHSIHVAGNVPDNPVHCFGLSPGYTVVHLLYQDNFILFCNTIFCYFQGFLCGLV